MLGQKDVQGSDDVAEALSYMVKNGVTLVGTAGSFVPPHQVDNAVYPPWRDAIAHVSLLTLWNTDPEAWGEMLDAQK
ncbi:hypothetical protein, partial [Klebsiella pneumoniae]